MFKAVDAPQYLKMKSTIRCGVRSMGLTLLVSHDSAVGTLGLACVVPLKGVFFFRFMAKIYNSSEASLSLIPGTSQKNSLRACRVFEDSWF